MHVEWPKSLHTLNQGRSQEFASAGHNTGIWNSPSGVQEQSPGGGLRAKPLESEDIYANNSYNNVF